MNGTSRARHLVRTGLTLVAIVFALSAVVGVVRLATAEESTVSRNLVVNREGLIDANNSPTLARNPRRPENVVLTHRMDRPRFSALVQWSLDGGATWQPSALPLPEGKDRPFAPDAAFGPEGTLFVTYVNLEGPGNVPDNLWLSTSSDGGRSFSPPVRIAGRLAFQARLAVDHGGTVHVTWLQAADVGLLRLVGSPNPVVASRSTDGGRTFAPPVQVSDPHRERVGVASPVVDSRGQLVVLYQDFKDDRRDFENLEGPAWENPFALVLTRSTDGGRSFAPGIEVDDALVPTRRFLVFLPDFPSLAAGPSGELYVAWSDGRHGDEDVFLRRSSDGGRTWAPPVMVNDNPRNDGTSQHLPRVAVAPGGRVDLVFLDRRRDPRNVQTDATAASSYDGGRSFSNMRISSTSFDSRVGPSGAPHLGVDFGSRLGLLGGDGRSLAAWTDTRFGNESSGRQDIVAATFRVSAGPGGIARLPVVVVLLALGVLALAASWAMGRSAGGAGS